MRIIAGKYGGQQLYAAKNLSIRPTTDRVKEYMFSILTGYVENARVLDLFSGAGGLGLESLSRGANSVTYVDSSYNSLNVLRKNVQRIQVKEDVQLVKKNALTFLRQNEQPFDLVFADPPFKWGIFDDLLPLVFKPENLSPNGVFLLESEKTHFVPWESELYTVVKQKNYDRSIVTLFARRENS